MRNRARVIGGLAALVVCLGGKGDPISIEQAGICLDALALLREQEHSGWIPFEKRPPDEDERQHHPDWVYVWDCRLPDDGQEILVSSKRYVWKDEWSDDGEDGSGLVSGDEICDGWAWMPMPEPYKPLGEVSSCDEP